MKPLAYVLAIVFFVIAVLYFFGILQLGAHEPGPHHKHAILFLGLSLLCFVWLRFQGGRADASRWR